MAYCWEELAGLAATHTTRCAARLFGAADALRASLGIPLPPVQRADCVRDVALVRAKMDEVALRWPGRRGVR